MYQFVKDIKFLEELKSTGKFSQCFFIVVTNEKGFWDGRETGGIYSFFRENKTLEGKIPKPTGKNENKSCKLSQGYKVEWKELDNYKDFRYFIVEVF